MTEKEDIEDRIRRMIRTYRVTLDIDIAAGDCAIKDVRFVKADNIKNVIIETERELL